MSDLNERELLECVSHAFEEKRVWQAGKKYDNEISKEQHTKELERIDQAYTQLVKIVEGHFSVIETDMGKWLYRFYESWKGCSLGISDKEAEEAYAEICKRLEKSIADQEQGDVQSVQFLCDDLILKIVEICEEPELAVWKIAKVRELLTRQPVQVDEEEDQPPMDRETAGDKKFHELKDEDRLDRFGRRKEQNGGIK